MKIKNISKDCTSYGRIYSIHMYACIMLFKRLYKSGKKKLYGIL